MKILTNHRYALITGIVLATEHHPDPAAEAHRLLVLTMEGVSPRG